MQFRVLFQVAAAILHATDANALGLQRSRAQRLEERHYTFRCNGRGSPDNPSISGPIGRTLEISTPDTPFWEAKNLNNKIFHLKVLRGCAYEWVGEALCYDQGIG